MGASLQKPQESETAETAAVVAKAKEAAPPTQTRQQQTPQQQPSAAVAPTASGSAAHATAPSAAAANAAPPSKEHVPLSKRLAKVAVWAIRFILVVEGAALAKAVLVRSLGGSSGGSSSSSSEEPSDAVDKLVDYLAGRRDADVLVPLGSEELLAAGEELDTEDLGRLGYNATSAELKQLLGKVVEAKRAATAQYRAAQAAAAAAGGAEGGAQEGAAAAADSEISSSRLRRPVLRRQPALHGVDGNTAAAGSSGGNAAR